MMTDNRIKLVLSDTDPVVNGCEEFTSNLQSKYGMTLQEADRVLVGVLAVIQGNILRGAS